MSIELPQQELDRIAEHGRQDYPNECCGALLGKEQGGRKIVTAILPLKNARAADEGAADEQSGVSLLLKQAYQLFVRIHPKDDLIRDWMQRADEVIHSARTRFRIMPEDFLKCDEEAVRLGVNVLGFYHSHPDHPAIPSEYDRQHLLCPWYNAYLILAVAKGAPRELTGWTVAEDQEHFAPDKIEIVAGTKTPAQ